jgi:pantoate kinase
VAAFSPSHITSIFEVYNDSNELLSTGSRGAGVSLSQGVKTIVKVVENKKPKIEIRINDSISNDALVSKNVVKHYLMRKIKSERNYFILVDHYFKVPIGSGFGSSGAGALSLSLALNKAMNANLSDIEAAQIAHMAEIESKTGLGTVIAETYGGLEIRTKPGAPGLGELRKISFNDNYLVVCLNLGPIFTNSILSSKHKLEQINGNGRKLVNYLMVEPRIDTFLQLSRKFANSVNLITKRVKRVLEDTDQNGFNCSMAMMGETVFSIVKKEDVESLSKIFYNHSISEQDVIISSIDLSGARIL